MPIAVSVSHAQRAIYNIVTDCQEIPDSAKSSTKCSSGATLEMTCMRNIACERHSERVASSGGGP
jgi:hypothetical protein